MSISQSAVRTRCVSCNEPLESPIGCLHCHTIFPPGSELNHFERLGLPETYRLDPQLLERRFLKWSRELHPDYFQLRPSTEQQLSLTLSAALNDAYATLKDPFRRAEYLLSLLGGPSPSEYREMPAEFLEEVLELRMEIEEVKESGNADSEAAKRIESTLQADRTQAMQHIADAFAAVESQSAGTVPREPLLEIRRQLNTVKYLDGLLRDLREP